MKKTPTIILFIQTMSGGGAERVALRLANYWSGRGEIVELVLVRAEGPLMKYLSPKVQIVSLDCPKTVFSLRKIRALLNARPGVPVLLFGIEVARVAILAKTLGSLDNVMIYREQGNPYASFTWTNRISYKFLVARADKVIVQNKTALNALGRLGVDTSRCIEIPNPISLDVGSRPVAARRTPLRLVAAGRLVEVKGFKRLLAAFPYLRSVFPGATLTIWGEGSLRKELEQIIDKLSLGRCVRLPGFTESADRIWNESDVFVLSSHFEGQPNVLLEALGRGVRVVSTPAGGGVNELFSALEIGDCIIDERRFSANLVKAIANALSMDVQRWETALNRYYALFGEDRCFSMYGSTCVKAYSEKMSE